MKTLKLSAGLASLHGNPASRARDHCTCLAMLSHALMPADSTLDD